MEKKKTRKWKQYLGVVLFMLIGAACGVLMASYMDQVIGEGVSMGEVLMRMLVLFMGMYAAMFIQIVIHEAGHMIFGLLSGYEFCSFRIFSLMWQKVDDKIALKRFSLAGTGGQCLMNPPEMLDGKIPYVLYNLGGSILNVIAGMIFIGFHLIWRDISMVSYMFLILAVVGFGFAVVNGVPMRLGTVDNDGYNALSLGKNPEALRSFWIQMKANHLQTRGVRLKDMPEEWFVVPSDKDMKNSMAAVMGVFVCNRLMDENKFDEAVILMKRLMDMETGIVGLYRSLMICDCMYCELIGENRKDVIDKMYTKEQKQFMKAMKTYLSVIRTEYVYALLAENDEAKAKTIKKRFEQAAQKYPFAGDLQCEMEYMELADVKFSERRNSVV